MRCSCRNEALDNLADRCWILLRIKGDLCGARNRCRVASNFSTRAIDDAAPVLKLFSSRMWEARAVPNISISRDHAQGELLTPTTNDEGGCGF